MRPFGRPTRSADAGDGTGRLRSRRRSTSVSLGAAVGGSSYAVDCIPVAPVCRKRLVSAYVPGTAESRRNPQVRSGDFSWDFCMARFRQVQPALLADGRGARASASPGTPWMRTIARAAARAPEGKGALRGGGGVSDPGYSIGGCADGGSGGTRTLRHADEFVVRRAVAEPLINASSGSAPVATRSSSPGCRATSQRTFTQQEQPSV